MSKYQFRIGREYSREFSLDTKPGRIAHWALLVLGLALLLAGCILLLTKSEAMGRDRKLILACVGLCCLLLWLRQRSAIRRLREKQPQKRSDIRKRRTVK